MFRVVRSTSDPYPDKKEEISLNSGDLVSLAALIVAILSAVITVYEQYFRGPRLSVLTASRCWLTYGSEIGPVGHILGVSIELALVNDGARNAAVVDLYCRVSRTDGGWEDQAIWGAFMTHNDAGDQAQFRSNFRVDIVLPSVLIVPSRTATSQNVAFFGTKRADLAEGDYTLEVGGIVGGKRRKFRSQRSCFTMSADAAEYLRDKCVGDSGTGRVPSSLAISLHA